MTDQAIQTEEQEALPVNFLLSWSAQNMTITSGVISALSSSFVIYFITRSRNFEPYHRIIFFMSVCDLITSIAISLTTIPMPVDVHEIYPFQGGAYGNVRTCEAQAFLIIVGLALTVFSNCALNIFYVCTIRYGMNENTVKTRLLPILLVIAFSIALPLGTVPLAWDFLNPWPYEPFCTMGSYPADCNKDSEIDCIRGGISKKSEWMIFGSVLLLTGINFALVVISLISVIMTIFKTERTIRRIKKANNGEDAPNANDEQNWNNTRFALRLALMYIGAFLITWVWTILALANIFFQLPLSFWHVIDRAKLIFLPLQGFFNAMIFIYSKIYILLRTNEDLTFFGALKQVILSPKRVPFVIVSSITMVGRDEENRHAEEAIQARVDADFAMVSVFSPASIPSNFESIETPSMNLSYAISKGSNWTFSNDGESNRKSIESDNNDNQSNAAKSRKSIASDQLIMSSVEESHNWSDNDGESEITSGGGGRSAFTMNSFLSGFNSNLSKSEIKSTSFSAERHNDNENVSGNDN